MASLGLIILIYLMIFMELFFTDSYIVLRYLHFSYLVLFLLTVSLFIYLSIIRSKKKIWLLPAFLFVSFQYLSPFISITTNVSAQQAEHHSPTYKFLSFSINSRNKDYQAVADLLKQHPADIVCLQEIPVSRYSLLLKEMKTAGVQYHHVYSKKRSLMILAAHPIVPNKTMPFLQATVDMSGKNLKIWNIHSPKSLTKKNFQDFYFDKLKQDIDADKSTHKLLCGDFNSTPHNDILPQFLDSFQAAYRHSINPASFTYPTPKAVLPSPIPLLKIDYLLLSRNFKIDHYARLAQYAASDHYPIYTIARFQDLP